MTSLADVQRQPRGRRRVCQRCGSPLVRNYTVVAQILSSELGQGKRAPQISRSRASLCEPCVAESFLVIREEIDR